MTRYGYNGNCEVCLWWGESTSADWEVKLIEPQGLWLQVCAPCMRKVDVIEVRELPHATIEGSEKTR